MDTLKGRLIGHLIASGTKPKEAEALALELMVKRGQAHPNGDLTEKGKLVESLGPKGRARLRAKKLNKE